MPLSLSDSEMDIVLDAAAPLPLERRADFLAACAEALGAVCEPGPGVTFRVVREMQSRFFTPPQTDTRHAPHQLRKVGRRR